MFVCVTMLGSREEPVMILNGRGGGGGGSGLYIRTVCQQLGEWGEASLMGVLQGAVKVFFEGACEEAAGIAGEEPEHELVEAEEIVGFVKDHQRGSRGDLGGNPEVGKQRVFGQIEEGASGYQRLFASRHRP